MHRVKFNDYAELLSDDLNNNNAYLYNGLITAISDYIAANDCVSGLEVTAQAVPDMTVYVKSGRVYQNGYQGLLEADLTTPLTIAPASSSQPRIDLICAKYEEVEDEPEIRNVMTDVVSRNITQVEIKTRIASSIAFQVVGGTAAAEPTVPTTPEGWVALAKVTVPANASVIQQSNIVDMRPELVSLQTHNHSGGINGPKIDYSNINNTPEIASQSEAEAQSKQNNSKIMTPLRVYQAIVAYFTQFLAAAVFTGIVKAVAPAAASNDNSVPTTSWVRTCFESMAKTVAEILEIQWKTEATGYLLLGPYLGNLKILWGFYFAEAGTQYCVITPAAAFTNCFLAFGMDNHSSDISELYPNQLQLLNIIPASKNSRLKFVFNRASSDIGDGVGYFAICR